MKIQALLTQAAGCKTKRAAATLRTALKKEFCGAPPMAKLSVQDSDADVKNGAATAHVTLSRVIGPYHITEIRPSIHAGKVYARVTTWRREGAMRTHADRREVIFTEQVNGDPTETLGQLARRVATSAMAHHQSLLQELAVPEDQAKRMAKKHWPLLND